MGDDDLKWWQALRWWWLTYLWYPLRGRCSWCGLEMVEEGDPRAGDGDVYEKGRDLGFGRWACSGCVEYGDG